MAHRVEAAYQDDQCSTVPSTIRIRFNRSGTEQCPIQRTARKENLLKSEVRVRLMQLTFARGLEIVLCGTAHEFLEGRRSGGYARERAGTLVLPLILYFQCVYAAVGPRIRFAARSEWNLPILTYFQHVTECYRVNAAFFADAGRALLIPNTFTRVNARYLYSYPAGDDMSTYIRCDSSAACL